MRRLISAAFAALGLAVLLFAAIIGALHALAMILPLFGLALGPLGVPLTAIGAVAGLFDRDFAELVAGAPIRATAIMLVSLAPLTAIGALIVWRRRRRAG